MTVQEKIEAARIKLSAAYDKLAESDEFLANDPSMAAYLCAGLDQVKVQQAEAEYLGLLD